MPVSALVIVWGNYGRVPVTVHGCIPSVVDISSGAVTVHASPCANAVVGIRGVVAVVHTSLIVALVAVAVPVVVAPIGGIVARTYIVEMAAIGVVGVDAEGKAVLPIHRTIEVFAGHIRAILIYGKHIAQVLVTALPVEAEDIVVHRKSHHVVEVDFIYSLVLLYAKVQLIGHFV